MTTTASASASTINEEFLLHQRNGFDLDLALTSTTQPTTIFTPTNITCGSFNATHISPYRFWCDGVLVSTFGTLGLAGNILALIILSRPKLNDVFHQLLSALACFDILYIICGGINYTFRGFQAQTNIFTYLFPNFLYPMSHVSMAGTIFMTVAISIERYLGLCHPMLPPHSRRCWMYVLPVIIISFAINIPKFMEIELVFETALDENGLNQTIPTYNNTELRFDENYIRYYIMWTRLFSTAVIPVTLMLILNVCIIYEICNTKVQRFGSERRQRKEINLCIILFAIVMLFFVCHSTRIILDVYEFANVEKIIQCKPWIPEFWAQILACISHFTMIVNSSVNFIVYCLVGYTFRRELCRAFDVRQYQAVPVSQVSRRPSTTQNNRYEYSNGNGTTKPREKEILNNTATASSAPIQKDSIGINAPTLNTDEITYCQKDT